MNQQVSKKQKVEHNTVNMNDKSGTHDLEIEKAQSDKFEEYHSPTCKSVHNSIEGYMLKAGDSL